MTELGERLRVFRLRRRCTLRALSTKVGLSQGFLSQIENGRASPSLASLQRIADALDITIADLFDTNGLGKPRVLRPSERPVLFLQDNAVVKYMLTRRPLQNVELLLTVLEPGAATGDQPYSHGDSEEVALVLEGNVEIRVGDVFYRLEAGDSLDYISSVRHIVTNIGSQKAEVLFVISPPSF